MGKKTKYVKLDWASRASAAPTAPPDLACDNVNGDGEPAGNEQAAPQDQLEPVGEQGGSSSRLVASAQADELQAGFENLSLIAGHGTTHSRPGDTPQESLPRHPSALSPPFAPAPGSTSRSIPVPTSSLKRDSPLPLNTPLRPRAERLRERGTIKVTPVPGKVYFMPDGTLFPDSVIHHQKKQDGFFRHPMMAIEVEGEFVELYAITKSRPKAIRDLNMALLLGINTEDKGPNVLRLAPDARPMLQESWVNLEQRFRIEWRNLDDWKVHVQVDQQDLIKLHDRVEQLERDQNRFIYKPLLRDLSRVQPGTIVMLPNPPTSKTFGAPVIVVFNNYPAVKFLRVKRFEDNINFNPETESGHGASRWMCLGISEFPGLGHDDTPLLVFDRDSEAMRNPSYVEVQLHPIAGHFDELRTWCWPPVKVCQHSMGVLRRYMAEVVPRVLTDEAARKATRKAAEEAARIAAEEAGQNRRAAAAAATTMYCGRRMANSPPSHPQTYPSSTLRHHTQQVYYPSPNPPRPHHDQPPPQLHPTSAVFIPGVQYHRQAGTQAPGYMQAPGHSTHPPHASVYGPAYGPGGHQPSFGGQQQGYRGSGGGYPRKYNPIDHGTWN